MWNLRIIFNEIKILPPGHILKYDKGKLNIVRYYNPFDYVKPRNNLNISFPNIIKKLESILLSSIKNRLIISDVPVGVTCSGGLDSSLITSMAHRINPNVSVFFVDVRQRGLSEREYVSLLANKLNLNLFTINLTESIYKTHLIDAIYHNEMPLIHPNSIGIFLVSQLARKKNHKVLLTGEGADELFRGYQRRYVYLNKYRKLKEVLKVLKVPSFLSKIIQSIERFESGSKLNLDLINSLKFGNLEEAQKFKEIHKTLNNLVIKNTVEKKNGL